MGGVERVWSGQGERRPGFGGRGERRAEYGRKERTGRDWEEEEDQRHNRLNSYKSFKINNN